VPTKNVSPPSSILDKPRLSIIQTAKTVGVSRPTIDRWLSFGVRGVVLPSVRIGGRRFVLRSDLEAFFRRLQEVPLE
jgi:predicted DNA-binding transcriptional regulator AlpA